MQRSAWRFFLYLSLSCLLSGAFLLQACPPIDPSCPIPPCGDEDDSPSLTPTDPPPTPTPSPTPPLVTPTPLSFPTPLATNYAPCGDTFNDAFPPYEGTLTCPDTAGVIQWDFFSVPVMAGDCVYVAADNAGAGAADLAAFAWDSGGNYYGLAPDYSQLDDELACRGFTATMDGNMWVGMFQWGSGDPATPCGDAAPADYQLLIAINGVTVDLSAGPALNNQAFREVP